MLNYFHQETVRKRENRIFCVIVAVSGFILALGLYLVLSNYFTFKFHDSGIVGWISVNRYPKQQEFFHYLFGLTALPLFTAACFFFWVTYSSLLARLTKKDVELTLKQDAFTYLPALLILKNIHLTETTFGQVLLFPLIGIATLKLFFFIVNALSLNLRKVKNAIFSETEPVFHSASILSGFCIGVFYLIEESHSGATVSWSLRILLTFSLLIWFFWLIYSRLLSHCFAEDFGEILRSDAHTYFPFALLLLDTIFFSQRNAGKILLIISCLSIIVLKARVIYNLLKLDCVVDRLKRLTSSILFYLVIPMLIYTFLYDGNLHGSIDLFHEGEMLGTANQLFFDKKPYRDIYIQHGFIQNILKPYLAFKLFGKNVRASRLLSGAPHAQYGLLAPLSFVCLYFLAITVAERKSTAIWALLLSQIVLGLPAKSTQLWLSERHGLSFLSLVPVLIYVESKKTRELVIAGVCTMLAILYSLEGGLFTLSATGLFLLIFGLASVNGSIRSRFTPVSKYGLGVLLAFLPFGLYLAKTGALDDFFHLSYVQARYQIPIWARAFPALLPELRKINSLNTLKSFVSGVTFRWYLPIFIYISALTYLLLRTILGNFRRRDWKMMLVLFNAIAFFRIALGRSDYIHLLYATPIFWVLLTLLLERYLLSSFKTESHHYIRRTFILLPLVIFIWYMFATYNPVETITGRIKRLSNYGVVPEGLVASSVDRVGVYVSEEQAAQIDGIVNQIRKNTEPDEYIFDFTDQGAYYFLINRPNPTRYCQATYASPEYLQKEVIRDLETKKPAYVLSKEGRSHDGISHDKRLWLIADYLNKHYIKEINVHGITILKRKSKE